MEQGGRRGSEASWEQTGPKEGERWEGMDYNTYRSEITNERHTFDGCRLDAAWMHSILRQRESMVKERKKFTGTIILGVCVVANENPNS